MHRFLKIFFAGVILALLHAVFRQRYQDSSADDLLPAPLPLAHAPEGVPQPNSGQHFISKPGDVLEGFHGG